MDEKNLVLYCILKGFTKTAKSLSTREENLYKLAKVPENYNSSFFDRVVEIVHLCVDTMGLELACKYLCISPEIAKALTSNESEKAFVEDVKGKIVDQFADLGVCVRSMEPHRPVSPVRIANSEVVMSGTDRTAGAEQFNGNFIGVPNAKSVQGQNSGAGKAIVYPLNSEHSQVAFKPVYNSMTNGMPHFGQGIDQMFRFGPGMLNIHASLPPPESSYGTGNYAAPSLPVTTSNQTAFNPLQVPHARRVVNPANLQEHKPNKGNIFNPDYSYIPNDIL